MIKIGPTLYTYVLRHDDGAAPNPFWGVCTLVICKPVIRRCANVGDWVVGTGSANSPIGDIRNSIVYIMKVTEVMTLEEYDLFTRNELPGKIPNWYSGKPKQMVGDSIYDFSHNPPKVRKSVHNEIQRDRDLGGINALISNHFYYFGRNPYSIPFELQDIVTHNQGHRSKSNSPFFEPFMNWLHDQDLKVNHLYGKPQGKLFDRLDVNLNYKSKCGN